MFGNRPSKKQIVENINRAGNNKLRDRNDYLDKKEHLLKLLSMPNVPVEDKAVIRDRLGQLEQAAKSLDEDFNDSPVASAVTRRILTQRHDLLKQYGPELVTAAIDNVADYVGDVEEIGSSDVSAWVAQVERMLKENPAEAFDEAQDNKQPGFGEFPPKQEIKILPPKKLKGGQTHQGINDYWRAQGQAPIYKTNEADDAYTRDVKAGQAGFDDSSRRAAKRAELQQELGHETNNIQIAINGKPWKVVPGKGYADSREERAYLEGMKRWAEKKSASSGKKWTVYLTGANVTESEEFEPTHGKSPEDLGGADAYYHRGCNPGKFGFERGSIAWDSYLKGYKASDEGPAGGKQWESAATESDIEKHMMEMRHAGYDIKRNK